MHNFNYKLIPNLPVKIRDSVIDVIKPEHIEQIRNWRNQQIRILRQAHQISPEDQIEYFKKSVWSELESLRPNQILLSINKFNTLIGYGGLVHINWDTLEAEVSFLLKTKLTSDLEEYNKLFVDFLDGIELIAGKFLKLRRLTLETYEFRVTHIQVIENSGYTRHNLTQFTAGQDRKKYNSVFHYKELK
jgi:hypothetical protein